MSSDTDPYQVLKMTSAVLILTIFKKSLGRKTPNFIEVQY